MHQTVYRWRGVLIAISMFMIFAVTPTPGVAQENQVPSGGRLPEEKPISKKVTPKSSKTRSKSRVIIQSSTKSSGPVARPAIGPVDSIAGKWWTSSNDFGTSQVFFELNGTSVSG